MGTRDPTDIPGIPPEARGFFRAMGAQPPASVAELGMEVVTHRSVVRRAGARGQALDVELAGRLADACLGLLATVSPTTSEAEFLLIQAAVRYFVLADDADSDFGSRSGFDDDRVVLNAVLRYLGHDHLCVESRARTGR